MYHGFSLGLLLVIIAITIWMLGINEKESLVPFLITSITTIGFITYAILLFRENQNQGIISYTDSLKFGTTIAFFAYVVFGIYFIIFIKYIHPDYITETLKFTKELELLNNPDISDKELNDSLIIQRKMMQPHWVFITQILAGTFAGFIYSLFISIFVKKS